jgi:hypothetical protein
LAAPGNGVNVQYFEDVRKIPKTDCPIPDRPGTPPDRSRPGIASDKVILPGIRIADNTKAKGYCPA